MAIPSLLLVFSSFLMRAKPTVTTRYAHPQNLRYPPSVKSPTSWGTVLKYRFEKSGALNAKNTVKDKNWPAVSPTVCAVDAYDRFSGDSSVSAQPAHGVSSNPQ